MSIVDVNIPERPYKIHIYDSFDNLAQSALDFCKATNVMVVTDSNVDKLYSDTCIKEIEKAGARPHKFVFSAGEKSKNLDTAQEIYKACMKNRLERCDTILALGGGVTGDIAGFAAATFLRGLNFVQVPTTVLSQCDSSIGGKVGADFDGVKNIIGAFYQPKSVYINTSALKSLPEREYISGFGEIVKHAIIKDEMFFDYLEANTKGICGRDTGVLSAIIEKNCMIKASVVSQDEKESGIRAILNFGHTIGHAIESAAEFAKLHGECVSIGMVAACRIAVDMEMIHRDDLTRVTALLKKLGLPVSCEKFNSDQIYSIMQHDKKASYGKLHFIIPTKIGQVKILDNIPENIIIKAIESLINS